MKEGASQPTEPPEAALDERDVLLSVAAHDIRTPLASLQFCLDAVIRAADRGPLDSADVGARLRKARRQCDRLNVLLNNLMDVARAPSQPLAVLLEQVDLVATVVAVGDRLREQFTRQGRTLEIVTPSGSQWGDWDHLRLEQVLTNLILNAHKHAPGAPVRVEVKACAEDRVSLTVSDEGPGIEESDRLRLVERFAQTQGAQTQGATGGIGLGIWIVARIVYAFGGTIRLDSAPGRGASFTVELPRHAAPPVVDAVTRKIEPED